MGVTISRLNSSDSHQSGSELRQRSQFNLHQLNASQPEQQPPPQQQQQQGEQDDGTMYSFYNQTNYSLARKHFSNYFIMAGERFDIDEPDYLFGDENDLNFLSCTKPYYLPYKQARLDLLALLNNKKQKATNRASRFRLPFNKFLPSLSADAVTRQTSNSTGHNNNNINQTNHHNHHSSTSNSNSRKQLQQQDELDMISRRIPTSPSKPLVMFVNIRKETLKLVPVKGENEIGNSNDSIDTIIQSSKGNNNERESNKSKKNDHVSQTSSSDETKAPHVEESSGQDDSDAKNSNNRVYNIQFNFDSEIDCTVRIFYFCTREVTSNGITYKPQHSTHKSKIYNYNKGMDQKFDQVEHTFRPHLFDEDLLMYRPLDKNGNYNPGAVFPLVVHIALNGSVPKQSYSLVATIEKSQLDNSYSIKPLKQLIFVNGVQYILQDIYGIEHKNLIPPTVPKKKDLPSNNNHNTVNGFNQPSRDNNNAVLLKTSKDKYLAKSHSLPLGLNSNNFNLNLNYRNNNNNDDNSNDNTSMNSINNLDSRRSSTRQSGNNHRDGSIRQRSLTSDANYECVICMSEERDTMLLPCRHLCLCGSCAQSLRYQANSCPICRCTFKAALNLRPCTASSHRANQNPTKRSSFASKQVSSTSPKISSKVLSNSNSGSSSGNNSNSSSCGNNNNNNIISRRETDRVAEGCAEAEEVIIESGVVGISMPEMSIDIPSSSGVIIEHNVGEKSTFREKIPTSTTPLLSTPTEVVVETNKQLPNVPSSATSAGSSSKSNSNNKQDYQTDAGNWSGNEF